MKRPAGDGPGISRETSARLDALAAEHDLPDSAVAVLTALLALQATDPTASTSVRDPADAVDRHVADSLSALDARRAARRAADRRHRLRRGLAGARPRGGAARRGGLPGRERDPPLPLPRAGRGRGRAGQRRRGPRAGGGMAGRDRRPRSRDGPRARGAARAVRVRGAAARGRRRARRLEGRRRARPSWPTARPRPRSSASSRPSRDGWSRTRARATTRSTCSARSRPRPTGSRAGPGSRRNGPCPSRLCTNTEHFPLRAAVRGRIRRARR